MTNVAVSGGAAPRFVEDPPAPVTAAEAEDAMGVALTDRRLSWAARGALAALVFGADDTGRLPTPVVEWLIAESPAGRGAVTRIVRELVEAGYLRRVQHRDRGRFRSGSYEINPGYLDSFAEPAVPAQRAGDGAA